MTTPTGTISLSDVNIEICRSSTSGITMNEPAVRTLAGVPSGAISMNNLRGKTFVPTVFGQSYGGGIYMGLVSISCVTYYLIVAPNSTGCAGFCDWKTTRTTTCFSSSCDDGYSNTYGALNNPTHPAGYWCATRTINGFSDWYLPAIGELNTIYDNGATRNNECVIGIGEAFTGGSYWSSTEQNQFNACRFGFYYGTRLYDSKTCGNEVRAVRRVPF